MKILHSKNYKNDKTFVIKTFVVLNANNVVFLFKGIKNFSINIVYSFKKRPLTPNINSEQDKR